MYFLLIAFIPMILPWIAKAVWPHEIKWAEMAVASVLAIVVAGAVYGFGLYDQTADQEIWNGQLVSKQRIHDTYEQSYECNCTSSTDSKGNTTRSCQTCYETHYTVEWLCNTTIGTLQYDKLDSTSRSVYKKPDPFLYTRAQVGDPVSRSVAFTNYVKAVPDSLFHQHDIQKFEKLIPPYPGNIYELYRINRALAAGVMIPDLADWNQDISLILRKLGPQKQANVITVFVNTNDMNYVQALEGKWIGGKKNDIIVIMGVTQYPKIDWVAVSSWTDSQIFKVQLRDAITEIGVVDRSKIIAAIEQHTMKSFVRKKMKDFEYLKAQIEPSATVLTLAVILSMLASIGSTFYFYKYDPFGSSYRSSRRRF